MKESEAEKTAGEGIPAASAKPADVEPGVAAAPEQADAPSAGADFEAELDQARALLEEYKDSFLRAKAEAENTRRRAEADVASARKFGVERFAGEMLAVKDSLDLARSVELDPQDSPALAKMLEGLELTLKQMDGVFERFSIEEVAAEVGEKFDPERHQAMTTEPSREMDPNHIVRVIQKGYRLHDRLLRPAMVIVASAAAPEQGQAGS